MRSSVFHWDHVTPPLAVDNRRFVLSEEDQLKVFHVKVERRLEFLGKNPPMALSVVLLVTEQTHDLTPSAPSQSLYKMFAFSEPRAIFVQNWMVVS